jgi:hypothetical protein
MILLLDIESAAKSLFLPLPMLLPDWLLPGRVYDDAEVE